MNHQRPEKKERGADISVLAEVPGGGQRAGRDRALRSDSRIGKSDPAGPDLKPLASLARPKVRHRRTSLSFMLLVMIPIALAAVYLYFVANDQYASKTGFSVRQEELDSAIEVLGGITNVSGSSSSDTDVLYEYIQSQEIVERIDAQLDLRSIYSKPDWDPVFAFDPEGTIEDLVNYWNRMVSVHYETGTGLIEIRALAFEPKDAQAIAQAVFDESSRMINELSAIAREDATGYTREELDLAVERLKDAREALTDFRSRTQIVDPAAELEGRMEVLKVLQGQLADAQIELELLKSEARDDDDARHLVRQQVKSSEVERRIGAMKQRIAEERGKFGIDGEGPGGGGYAALVDEYERLALDRKFAEQIYLSAFTSYNEAMAEAQRQSRYLAAYVKPTLAQRAEYPRREILLGLVALFLLLGWSVAVLVFYSLKERR